MERQDERYQTPFKSSWHFDRAHPEDLDRLRQALHEAGVEAKVVYSSHRDLDILPAGATKGGALRWLGGHLGIAFDEMLVAGDTGNDASMFQLPGVHGIIVQNAQTELFEATVAIPVLTTRQIMADGVLEGLRHYGVLKGEAPTALQTEIPRSRMAPGFRMLFTGTRLGALNEDDKRLILRGYEKAIVALKKNITAPTSTTARSGRAMARSRSSTRLISTTRRCGTASVARSTPCSTPPPPTARSRPTCASTTACRITPASATSVPSTAGFGSSSPSTISWRRRGTWTSCATMRSDSSAPWTG
jgi:hypothetical protein